MSGMNSAYPAFAELIKLADFDRNIVLLIAVACYGELASLAMQEDWLTRPGDGTSCQAGSSQPGGPVHTQPEFDQHVSAELGVPTTGRPPKVSTLSYINSL
jgi:hypothetical protein